MHAPTIQQTALRIAALALGCEIFTEFDGQYTYVSKGDREACFQWVAHLDTWIVTRSECGSNASGECGIDVDKDDTSPWGLPAQVAWIAETC